jgi:hypothetical protein
MVSGGGAPVAAPFPIASKHAVALLVALGVVLAAAAGGATAVPPTPPEPPPRLVGHEPRPEPAPKTGPAPGPTVVFRGRVLGPGGRPVAGARFWVTTDAWASPAERGRSGPDGSYRIEIPEGDFAKNFKKDSTASPPVQTSAVVAADGFGVDWANLDAGTRDGRPAMKPEYVRDFHLPDDHPIVGRIVDAVGKPVAGADVAISDVSAPGDGSWGPILDALKALNPNVLSYHGSSWSSPMNPLSRAMMPPATTDAEGRFRIAGVGRDRLVHLRVKGPGVLPRDVTVVTREDVDDLARAVRAKFPRARQNGMPAAMAPAANPGAPVFGPTPEVDVDPARTVSGVVLADDTGAPLGNLSLGVSGGYEQINPDARGHYRGLRPDSPGFSILAWHWNGDYLDAARKFEGAGPGEVVADFRLRRGIVATGRVVEAGTGRPIVSSPRDECGVAGALQAGFVHYFPLASNATLRGTPEGLAFQLYATHRTTTGTIGGDGTFRLVVPPGPGVLVVEASPGLGMFTMQRPLWREVEDGRPLHRLFPYLRLKGRSPDDGAPRSGDAKTFDGLAGPIPLEKYHAYRVIDPPADAGTMTADFTLARAPTRVLRFVDPDGQPVRGLAVRGLLGVPWAAAEVEGPEAEATGLDPDRPREILAVSNDGRFHARTSVAVGPEGPSTIRLEPAGSVAGRLVDDAGRPLAKHHCFLQYVGVVEPEDRIPQPTGSSETDADGRFRAAGIVPGLRVSASFQGPVRPGAFMGPSTVYRPASVRDLVLRQGEARSLGDIEAGPAPH